MAKKAIVVLVSAVALGLLGGFLSGVAAIFAKNPHARDQWTDIALGASLVYSIAGLIAGGLFAAYLPTGNRLVIFLVIGPIVLCPVWIGGATSQGYLHKGPDRQRDSAEIVSDTAGGLAFGLLFGTFAGACLGFLGSIVERRSS